MPAPPPAAVSVRGLAKRYGPVEAVRGVSFDVAAGEIFGLLGPNGAGKTTTLECILGLRRPDAGTIALAGVDALAQPDRAKERVGAQLQDAALQDQITPRQALRLFAGFYRAPAGVDELIDRFALAARADAPFAALSSGQRRRLFLALAFVNRPQVVVLDEPTAGLDPQARRRLHQIIAGGRAAGQTVLLSTHDLGEARALCDRIGILDGGRLIAVARPADLVAGGSARPRIAVRTAPPLTAAQVAALPGVVDPRPHEDGWLLGTADASRTIAGLARLLEAGAHALVDLQIVRPSLEDAYLELTGRAWAAPEPEDE